MDVILIAFAIMLLIAVLIRMHKRQRQRDLQQYLVLTTFHFTPSTNDRVPGIDEELPPYIIEVLPPYSAQT